MNGNDSKLFFSTLSFLRFPLALWVVFHHVINAQVLLDFNKLPLPVRVLSNTGNLAPTVFFILSGFVIYNCLLNGKVKFYYNRFVTIIPLYLISTLIIFSQLQKNYSELFLNLLGLNTLSQGQSWFSINGPAWSLSLEIYFYLLAPLIFNLVNKFRNSFIMIVYFAQVIVLVTIQLIWGPEIAFHYTYHNIGFQLLNFVTGMCAGKIFHLKLTSKMLRFHSNKYLCIAFIAFFLGIYYSGTTSIEFLKYGILITPGATLLIYTLAHLGIKPNKNLRVISKLGDAAFPIYIMHWIFIGYIKYFVSGSTKYFIMFTYFCAILTIIGLIVNKYLINYLKGKSKFSFKNLSIPMILILAIFVNHKYPSYDSPNTFKSNVYLNASLKKDSGTPQILIENLSNLPIKINNCKIFIKKEIDTYRMNGDYFIVIVGVDKVLSGEIGFVNFKSPSLLPANSKVKCN